MMNPNINSLAAVSFVESPYLAATEWKQVRFPRSQKVRIRKKWRKDIRNWKEVDATGHVYLLSFLKAPVCLVRPEMMERLKAGFVPNVRIVRNVQNMAESLGIDISSKPEPAFLTKETLLQMFKNCGVKIDENTF